MNSNPGSGLPVNINQDAVASSDTDTAWAKAGSQSIVGWLDVCLRTRVNKVPTRIVLPKTQSHLVFVCHTGLCPIATLITLEDYDLFSKTHTVPLTSRRFNEQNQCSLAPMRIKSSANKLHHSSVRTTLPTQSFQELPVYYQSRRKD